MYSKNNLILGKLEYDLNSYIEGNDIFNSKLIYLIPKLPTLGEYKIDLSEYRIDLISKDVYDVSTLGEIILLYNGLTIDQLHKGTTIKVPDISHVTNLMNSINSIYSPRDFIKTLES